MMQFQRRDGRYEAVRNSQQSANESGRNIETLVRLSAEKITVEEQGVYEDKTIPIDSKTVMMAQSKNQSATDVTHMTGGGL